MSRLPNKPIVAATLHRVVFAPDSCLLPIVSCLVGALPNKPIATAALYALGSFRPRVPSLSLRCLGLPSCLLPLASCPFGDYQTNPSRPRFPVPSSLRRFVASPTRFPNEPKLAQTRQSRKSRLSSVADFPLASCQLPLACSAHYQTNPLQQPHFTRSAARPPLNFSSSLSVSTFGLFDFSSSLLPLANCLLPSSRITKQTHYGTINS
jgi:hypothetical protein